MHIVDFNIDLNDIQSDEFLHGRIDRGPNLIGQLLQRHAVHRHEVDIHGNRFAVEVAA